MGGDCAIRYSCQYRGRDSCGYRPCTTADQTGSTLKHEVNSVVSDLDPAAEHTEVLADQKFHQKIVGVEKLAQEATTPLRRWEESLELPIFLLVLPLFAFLNAGVVIDTSALSGLLAEPVRGELIFRRLRVARINHDNVTSSEIDRGRRGAPQLQNNFTSHETRRRYPRIPPLQALQQLTLLLSEFLIGENALGAKVRKSFDGGEDIRLLCGGAELSGATVTAGVVELTMGRGDAGGCPSIEITGRLDRLTVPY